MKKTIALMLAALLLTACTSGAPAEDADELAAPDEAAYEAAEAAEAVPGDLDLNPLPDESMFVDYLFVDLSGDPVYENGVLILNVDKDLWYEDDAPVSVGYILSASAESMGGKIVTKDYPEMVTEEGDFRGIAIRPAAALPSGNCLYSVSFGNYMATFEMTVD